MTPDFSLSLFLEGIRLHRRTAEGWELVGEIPLDSPDLARDLAALRQSGTADGAPWRGTRLLLPPQQVRTLELEGERDEAAVRAALEGVTPYPVEDLVVDQAVAERRTHVAAVARETLDEAEAFAAGHGFRPLAFAAVLEGFPREAEFGPTRFAATLAREPEVAPAEENGVVAGEPDATDRPDAAETPKASLGSTPLAAEAAPVPAETTAEEAPTLIEATAEVVPAEEPDSALAGPETAPEPEPAAEEPDQPSPAAEPPAVAPKAPVLAPLSATGAQEPIFASHARPLQGERRESGVGRPVPTPPKAAGTRRAEPTLRTLSADGAWVLLAPAAAARADEPMAPPADSARRKPEIAAPLGEPEATPPASTTEVLPAPGSRAASTTEEPGRGTLFRARTPSGRAAARVGGKPRHLGLILTVALLIVMAAVAVLAATSGQGLAGLFGQGATAVAAVPPVPEPETPDVVLSAARAAPAAEPETMAAAPQSPPAPGASEAEAASAAVAAALAALPRAGDGDGEARTSADDGEAASVAEAGTAPESSAASPASGVPADEADRVYAATGVWLRAPRLPLLPQADDKALDGAVLPALSPAKALPAPPVLAALDADSRASAPIDPPPAGDTLPRDGRGLILATPEGTLAPSGVRLVAVSPALVPPTRPRPATAPEASGWVNAMSAPPGRVPPERPDAPPGFAANAASPAAAPVMQGPPTPGTPEAAAGAGAPWVNAMAEAPGRLPPERPAAPPEFPAALAADPAEPAALSFAEGSEAPTPGGVSLAGLRPETRPEDLSPAEDTEPPPVILSAFDGPRPGLRPEGLAPEEPASQAEDPPEAPDVSGALAEALTAPEAPAAPDLQSTLATIVQGAPDPLAGATPRAVAVARIPDSRPRNFDRVVRQQVDRVARISVAGTTRSGGAGGVGTRGLTAQEQAEDGDEPEVASGAAAVPSGRTATSVAQAATHADAMALRDINLIGVYGQPGARRALVRLGNGRYLRVGVGDQIDGGQVTAIGDNALNYVRRGRTMQLVIPGG